MKTERCRGPFVSEGLENMVARLANVSAVTMQSK